MKYLLLIILTVLYGLVTPKLGYSQKDAEQDKTRIDFTESTIEGKIKAPEGFFLQGRKSQSLSQMVKLRSEFRKKLWDSSYVVEKVK